MNYIIYIVLIIPIFGVISAGVICLRGMIISRKMQAINSLINQICWGFTKQDIWRLKQDCDIPLKEYDNLKNNLEKIPYKQIMHRLEKVEETLFDIKDVLFELIEIQNSLTNAVNIINRDKKINLVVLGYKQKIEEMYNQVRSDLICHGYKNQLNNLKRVQELVIQQLNLARIGSYSSIL